MLNINRRDVPPSNVKDADKPLLKPQQGTASNPTAPAQQLQLNPRPGQPAASTPAPPQAPVVAKESVTPPAPAIEPSTVTTERDNLPVAIGPDFPGSKLCVGPKIKLKGVEISDCDVLVVEGEVEATVNSKAMQIAEPGTLKGQVTIDVAEIFGDFSGELTARTKLIVHGTGRVSGTIRYGKLIVAEGGVINGDIQRLEGSEAASTRSNGAHAAHALG